MARRRAGRNHAPEQEDGLPPLPLKSSEWNRAVQTLGLSPQQASIVGLLLRGRQDKQIAADLRLSVSTVRTYLERMFVRLDLKSRVELVLRVFTAARNNGSRRRCHLK